MKTAAAALVATGVIANSAKADNMGFGITGSVAYGLNTLKAEPGAKADEATKTLVGGFKGLSLPWTFGLNVSYDFGDDNMFGVSSDIEWSSRSGSLANETAKAGSKYQNDGVGLAINFRLSPVYSEDMSFTIELGPCAHFGFMKGFDTLEDGKSILDDETKKKFADAIPMVQVGGNVNIGADFANHIIGVFLFGKFWFMGGFELLDSIEEVKKMKDSPDAQNFKADKMSFEGGLRLVVNLMPLFA